MSGILYATLFVSRMHTINPPLSAGLRQAAEKTYLLTSVYCCAVIKVHLEYRYSTISVAQSSNYVNDNLA